MNIRGIYKTSLIDYPGKISTVIFIGGCNLRCRYCHNPDIVLNNNNLECYSKKEVLGLLKKRCGIIDGVTISGGEPTIAGSLVHFLTEIREMELYIKLDTNGLRPDILEELIRKNLIDYVAIDVKTSPEKYRDLTNCDADFSRIIRAIEIIKESGIDYELRTTCFPEFVTEEDLTTIKKLTGHVKRYFIQQFVGNTPLIDKSWESMKPYPVNVLKKFRDIVRTFSDICEIRGI